MKSKIKSMLLACTMAVSCLPFSWTSANAATPDYSLWDKFIKYDLCITDYDSLTNEEKDLCHFIFDAEKAEPITEPLIVPEEINGYPLTAIEEEAFRYSLYTEVILPEKESCKIK